jgi:hypothetical protein
LRIVDIFPIALGLRLVVAVPGDLGTASPGAPRAVGPPHRPDGLEAIGAVDQGSELDHRRGITRGPDDPSPRSVLAAESIPETADSHSPHRNPG